MEAFKIAPSLVFNGSPGERGAFFPLFKNAMSSQGKRIAISRAGSAMAFCYLRCPFMLLDGRRQEGLSCVPSPALHRGWCLCCAFFEFLSPRPRLGCRFATIHGVPVTKPNRAETLARVPIFSGLSETELAFLAQRTVPRDFSAGEAVFAEGEPCTGLYVVESGHVRIFKSSPGGREHVLSIEGPGSSVAELPVFDGGNYPASVSAIDDATLLFISKQDFSPYA